MTVIGLTGGIASGKSTAAEMLREFGAIVIDGDRLGHRSYEPGTPGFQKVVNAFGHDIVGKDGVIDRRVLGGKVFGAPEQMERLNSIVWPEIRNLIREEVRQIRAQDAQAIIVLEAAVLLEAGWEDLADEIWVVSTPVEVAVERLRNRNGLSEDAAMARINSQMSNEERESQAQVVVQNAGTEDELRDNMAAAWQTLITRLGHGKPAPAKAPAKASSGAKKKAAAKPKAAATKAKPSTSKPASKASKPAPKAAAKTSTKPAAKPAAKKAAAATKAKPTARGAAKPAPKTTAAKAAAKPAATKATTSKAKPAPKAAAAKPAKAAAKSTATKATAAPKKAATTSKPAAKAKPAASTTKSAAARKPATATRAAASKTTTARTSKSVKPAKAAKPAGRSGARSK